MPAFFHWPLEASSVDVLRSLVGQRITGIALTGFEEAKPHHLRLNDVVLETDLGLVGIDAWEWECTDKFKVSVFLPRIARVDEPPQRWYRAAPSQSKNALERILNALLGRGSPSTAKVWVYEPPQRWSWGELSRFREALESLLPAFLRARLPDPVMEPLPRDRLAFEDVAPIRRVVVYSLRDEYSDDGLAEWTEYDHAFLFERDSGTAFLLRVDIESIAGFLFLVQDQEAIAELVAVFTPRLVLE
ncbi:MAG: hypothetical protein IAE99_04110 [Rhodothermales bacterium]|nr:hypothetical protein [Rhodothermales bacterium]